MSVIGDALKKIPGFSDVADIASDFGGIAKDNAPIIGGFVDYFKGNADNRGQRDISGLLRDSIQRDYDQQKAEQMAYADYLNRASAARSAASTAAAAAANATDKNRRKAAAKASKRLMAGYAQAKDIFNPYAQMGYRLLPKVEGTYGNALGQVNSLLAGYMAPEMQSRVNQVSSIYNTKAPLPKV